LPVGCRECLRTEVTAAGQTCEPLDTTRRGLARIEALTFEWPAAGERVEVAAVRVGAMGWCPA
jgi:hypothetical protein